MFGRKQLVIDKKNLEAELKTAWDSRDLAIDQVAELKLTLEAQRDEALKAQSLREQEHTEALTNLKTEWEKTLKDVEQAHNERIVELETESAAVIKRNDEKWAKVGIEREAHFNDETSTLRQSITHYKEMCEYYRNDLQGLNERFMALKHEYRWAYDPGSDTHSNEYFNLIASRAARSGRWDLMDDRDGNVVAKSVDYDVVLMICHARSKDRYFGADA